MSGRWPTSTPGPAHVRSLGLGGRPDAEVWERAGRDGFVLVSKDGDFFQRAVLFGPPPQVVWLQIGNGPTRVAEGVLRGHVRTVEAFVAGTAALLCLPLRRLL